MLKRAWNSPTITTWGSFLSRTLNVIVLLPYVLVKFSNDELNIWFIIGIIISLIRLLDMGFSQTFMRVLSYARAGSRVQDLSKFSKSNIANYETIIEIYRTMGYIYKGISFVVFVVLLTFGTLFFYTKFMTLSNDNHALYVWIVVVFVSTYMMYGNIYTTFLQGMNHIAILRRWEIFSSLGNIFSSVLILYFNGGLFELIAVQQFWILFSVIRNKYLVSKIELPFNIFKQKYYINKDVFSVVWSSAWKSGLGVLMSFGLVQISGLVYTSIGNTEQVTSYLFGLRIIQILSEFSRAPFYSKIPFMASVYAKHDFEMLLKIAKKSIQLSLWSYIIAFFFIALLGDLILDMIGSNTLLPEPLLWSLFGLAFFLERYGAMHLQLYSLTNDIVWHKANGIAGSIFIVLSIIFYNFFGVYSFLLAYIFANVAYSLYSARKSYRIFHLKILKFEKHTIIMFLILGILLFQSFYKEN
ncbi:hypothetical protein KKG72_03735 [bacterium]|nr:hypothetical protein [bacterium]MBU1993803.1 hypothetical protein [bacterium]